MYTENDLVRVAKRENNNKRTYLVMNKLQGKHIPVSPKKAMELFGELADTIQEAYKDECPLIVGFAETATAISAAVAGSLDCYYIQTTREIVEDAEYLYFSEAHSHAMEQKLVKNHIDEVIGNVSRVVFIEDEVTTGNTILDLVNVMEQEYGKNIRFSVASILNGMNEESMHRYDEKGITLHYLVKTNHDSYDSRVERFLMDGEYWSSPAARKKNAPWMEITGGSNARKLVKSLDYQNACLKLWNAVDCKIARKTTDSILVLGTEEFMYPALYIAMKIEETGCRVRFHATTRSPIMVNSQAEYPLHKRFEQKSLYDETRVTYVYELSRYDQVLVITDTPNQGFGWESLNAALEASGNTNINWIRWCQA